MSIFKIGQRVIGCGTQSDMNITGLKGTIRDGEKNYWSVEFDKPMGGHNCDGIIKSRNGWFCNDSVLKSINNSFFKVRDFVLVDDDIETVINTNEEGVFVEIGGIEMFYPNNKVLMMGRYNLL